MEAVIAICILADRGAGSDIMGIVVTKKLLIGWHFLPAKANWDLTDLPIVGSFVGGVRSFVLSLVRSLVRLFVHSFVGLFVGSFDRGTSRLARYRVPVRIIMTRATKLLSVSAFVVAVDVLAFVVAVASRDLSPTALRIARLTARLKYLFSNGTSVLTMYVC